MNFGDYRSLSTVLLWPFNYILRDGELTFEFQGWISPQTLLTKKFIFILRTKNIRFRVSTFPPWLPWILHFYHTLTIFTTRSVNYILLNTIPFFGSRGERIYPQIPSYVRHCLQQYFFTLKMSIWNHRINFQGFTQSSIATFQNSKAGPTK